MSGVSVSNPAIGANRRHEKSSIVLRSRLPLFTCCYLGNSAVWSWLSASGWCKRSAGHPFCSPGKLEVKGQTYSAPGDDTRLFTQNTDCQQASPLQEMMRQVSSPEKFHTTVCSLAPDFRWWCGNTCSRCSSWRSWWKDEWWGCPAGRTAGCQRPFHCSWVWWREEPEIAQQHGRWTRNSELTSFVQSALTFVLGSIRLTPCLLIAIRRVSG